jgi:hypothetical protein
MVIIPYMCAVYIEQIYPDHYIPIPPFSALPFFKQCLVGFIMLSSYVYM